jgi:hypothetical protein
VIPNNAATTGGGCEVQDEQNSLRISPRHGKNRDWGWAGPQLPWIGLAANASLKALRGKARYKDLGGIQQ